jgi:hypothetical protein
MPALVSAGALGADKHHAGVGGTATRERGRLLEIPRARSLIAGVALFCLLHVAFPLEPTRRLSQYVQNKWSDEQGFIGGEVYAIGQSADGYLWIGTDRGLVRFDGSRFTLMQRPLPDEPPIGSVLGIVSDA